MKEALGLSVNDSFPYYPDKVVEFCKQNTQKLVSRFKFDGFAHGLDIDRFIEMLRQCSSEQIHRLRLLFRDLYANKRYIGMNPDIISEDLNALKDLYTQIRNLRDYDGYDKIQKMQIMLLARNLNKYIWDFEAPKRAASVI